MEVTVLWTLCDHVWHCPWKKPKWFQTRLQPTQPLSFLSSWLLLVLRLLPSMTLFANHPTNLFVLLSVPNGLLFYSPMLKSGTPLPMRKPTVSSNSTSSSQVRIPPLPALTTYRAHMMYMTVLSILRVVGDFPETLWITKPFEFLWYEV